MIRAQCLAFLFLATPLIAAEQTVRVVDMDSLSVENFEVMWYAADGGS